MDVVYIDFRKAFDSVPHKRLLLKLHGYGIHSDLLLWLTNFLTGRMQKVVIGNDSCDWSDVISVPQGSVLGPLLFAIYVNDFPQVVESLIADDTLYRIISTNLDIA